MVQGNFNLVTKGKVLELVKRGHIKLNKLNAKLKVVRNNNLQKRRRYLGIFFLVPALVISLLVIGYPLLQMLNLSFREYNLMRPTTLGKFIGITNFVRAFTNYKFRNSLGTTLIFTFLVTILGYIIGLFSALLLNSLKKVKGFFTVSICLPWAIPGAIAAYIFLQLFQSPGGIITYWISIIGLDVSWITQKLPSLFLVVIVATWKSYPFVTMGLLAGLQTIPNEIYEAASIDGASNFRKLFSITLPALKPITTVLLILNGTWAFKNFEIIWILTGGGPARFTQTLGIDLYNKAFVNFNFGYASSIGVIMLIISLFIIFLYMRLMMKESFY